MVIGKFMPLHIGHCALIRFAAGHCDELIVSMTYKPEDVIPGPIRFEWLEEEFINEPSIKPELSLDNFDDESLPLSMRMPLWSAFLKRRFPPIDVVVSSEAYGVLLAKELGAAYISFDPERTQFPVSATMIRSEPLKFWDFIAVPGRPYFVKKVCFFGPESTGKSTMAKHFANLYNTEFVPEVSRELITSNDFTMDDIIRIGEAQTQRVIDRSRTANKLLFCDTDLITTEIYSRHYLKQIPPILFELEKKVKYDQYFLFDIDVPWVADEIRDLGRRRAEMFDVFKAELDNRKIKYQLVKGSFAQREDIIKSFVDSFIR